MRKEKKTTEEMVAEKMLELPRTVMIGGRKYNVPKFTFATMMFVSSEISKLPKSMVESEEGEMYRAVKYAKDYAGVSRVLAAALCPSWLMMFGRLGNFIFRCLVARKSAVLRALYTPRELHQAKYQLVNEEQLAHFFLLSTSLLGLNMTRPTKEVETTVHGQQ